MGYKLSGRRTFLVTVGGVVEADFVVVTTGVAGDVAVHKSPENTF